MFHNHENTDTKKSAVLFYSYILYEPFGLYNVELETGPAAVYRKERAVYIGRFIRGKI